MGLQRLTNSCSTEGEEIIVPAPSQPADVLYGRPTTSQELRHLPRWESPPHTGSPSVHTPAPAPKGIPYHPDPMPVTPLHSLEHIAGFCNKANDRDFVPVQNERRCQSQQEHWNRTGHKSQWSSDWAKTQSHSATLEVINPNHVDEYWHSVKEEGRSHPATHPLPGVAPRRLSINPIQLPPAKHLLVSSPKKLKEARANARSASTPPAEDVPWFQKIVKATAPSILGSTQPLYHSTVGASALRMPSITGNDHGAAGGAVVLPHLERPHLQRRKGIQRYVREQAAQTGHLWQRHNDGNRQAGHRQDTSPAREMQRDQQRKVRRLQMQIGVTSTVGHHWDGQQLDARPVEEDHSWGAQADEIDPKYVNKSGDELLLQPHGGRSPIFRRRQGGSPTVPQPLQKVDPVHMPLSPSHHLDMDKQLGRTKAPHLQSVIAKEGHMDDQALKAHQSVRWSEEQQMLMRTKLADKDVKSRLVARRGSTLGELHAQLPVPIPEVSHSQFGILCVGWVDAQLAV